MLDGVYRLTDRGPVFQTVPAPSAEQLQSSLSRIVPRVMKSLTRKGALIEEQGLPYLADPDADPALAPLHTAACTYRIGIGILKGLFPWLASKPRRVVANVEWHPDDLYARGGFIVTNLSRSAERVTWFYNQRGNLEFKE